MKNNQSWDKQQKLILKGLENAYHKLILFKREKNSPLIVSKDGKIVELDANEVRLARIKSRS